MHVPTDCYNVIQNSFRVPFFTTQHFIRYLHCIDIFVLHHRRHPYHPPSKICSLSHFFFILFNIIWILIHIWVYIILYLLFMCVSIVSCSLDVKIFTFICPILYACSIFHQNTNYYTSIRIILTTINIKNKLLIYSCWKLILHIGTQLE